MLSSEIRPSQRFSISTARNCLRGSNSPMFRHRATSASYDRPILEERRECGMRAPPPGFPAVLDGLPPAIAGDDETDVPRLEGTRQASKRCNMANELLVGNEVVVRITPYSHRRPLSCTWHTLGSIGIRRQNPPQLVGVGRFAVWQFPVPCGGIDLCVIELAGVARKPRTHPVPATPANTMLHRNLDAVALGVKHAALVVAVSSGARPAHAAIPVSD